jgi:hypothetical protein
MKTTVQFKEKISAQLKIIADQDPLFATSMQKEGKNIDDCITYILNTVQKSGCNGFDDAEIYGMAAHYYDEDKVEVGKPVNCTVVVNHKVDLTAQEIAEEKKKALDKVMQDEYERLKSSKKKVEKKAEYPTLF